jgi:hypothetical protein
MDSLLELFNLKPKANESTDSDQRAFLEAKQQESYEARFKARVVQVGKKTTLLLLLLLLPIFFFFSILFLPSSSLIQSSIHQPHHHIIVIVIVITLGGRTSSEEVRARDSKFLERKIL